MATFLQHPSFLNTPHSNSSHSSSSFCLNFINICSNLQNSRLQSRIPLLNSSQKIRVTKAANSALPLEVSIQRQWLGSKVTSRYKGGLIHRKLIVRASEREENTSAQGRSFLSFEEAGLVEMSGLSTHERFLCRLTISSLNLLRVIAEQEGCEIEELNAGRICDWFLKDKLKREQNIGSAILQWEEDSDDFQF